MTIEKLKNQVKELEEQLESLDRPFRTAITALEVKQNEATQPTRDKLANKKEELRLAEVRALKEKRQALFDTAQVSVLSDEQFKSFANIAHEYYKDQHWIRFCGLSSSRILKCASVPGMIVKGVQEYADSGNKFYAAWHEKSGKLAGVLSMAPTRHPGDDAQASGYINGKPVQFKKSGFGVARPVKTWIGMLRGVSEL